MSVLDTKKSEKLIKALLAIKTPDEAKRFMRDLLTEAEIAEFGNRFCAAEMLTNKAPYSEIEKETGLSSTTVARVSKWLQGSLGGYRLVIGRLSKLHHHAHTTTSTKERIVWMRS